MGGVSELNCAIKYTRLMPINHRVELKTESQFESRLRNQKAAGVKESLVVFGANSCRGDLCELSVDTFSSLICSKYRSVTQPQSFS